MKDNTVKPIRNVNVPMAVPSFSRNEELLAKVMSYQHGPLIERMQGTLDLKEEEAKKLFDDTKRFLFLCGTIEDTSFAPTKMIDECWHTFLLYTQDYGPFCTKFFGDFIHHCPLTPAEMATSDGSMVKRTLATANAVYGERNLSENWEYRGHSASCGQKCSGTSGDIH